MPCRTFALPAYSNPFSVHEVHVDAEQLAFFRQALAEAAGRPVVVFTHAPILGSGLKVVQTVHVKNRWGLQRQTVGQGGGGLGMSPPVSKGVACEEQVGLASRWLVWWCDVGSTVATIGSAAAPVQG